MDLYETVIALFCDPEGNPCMAGSDGDREVLAAALMEHRKALRPSDAPADVGKLKEECKEALVRHGVKTVSDKRLAWEGLIGATIDYLASRNLIRTPDVWQTIDTAPKDGSMIIVFDRIAIPARYVGEKVEDKKTEGWYFGGRLEDYKGYAFITLPVNPTHWMPLPAPPIRTEPTDGGVAPKDCKNPDCPVGCSDSHTIDFSAVGGG